MASQTSNKLTVFTLITTTYFMVAGGPYGLEDIVYDAGYKKAILILLLTPLLWSLPTALMVSELASAIPEEGGFYAWVKRGLGPFWGFQEAWLTLVGSIFDMAIYPTLFVGYLKYLLPSLGIGWHGAFCGFMMIAACTVWNLFGTKAVGLASASLSVVLLGPFVVLVLYALMHRTTGSAIPTESGHLDILAGILIAMWNYMGWDNASTIAGEVDRPQRTYPIAMFGTVILVAVTYILPIAAVAGTGLASAAWSTGGWAGVARTVFERTGSGLPSAWIEVARRLMGSGLALAITVGGMVGAAGTFNALTLSLSRLPLVLAEDGFLPRIFLKRSLKTDAPWVAILACTILWTLALHCSFLKLIVLDVLLMGLSVLLEFAALIALRIKEPALTRPYRVPGGLAGAILIGLPPLALMVITIIRNHDETVGGLNALTLGAMLMASGAIVYGLIIRGQKRAANG